MWWRTSRFCKSIYQLNIRVKVPRLNVFASNQFFLRKTGYCAVLKSKQKYNKPFRFSQKKFRFTLMLKLIWNAQIFSV